MTSNDVDFLLKRMHWSGEVQNMKKQKEIQAGNDQEMAQSERNDLSKTRGLGKH